MKIITRRHGESFTVGDVEVAVMGIQGGRVRLGVRAPKHMAIVCPESEPAGPDVDHFAELCAIIFQGGAQTLDVVGRDEALKLAQQKWWDLVADAGGSGE